MNEKKAKKLRRWMKVIGLLGASTVYVQRNKCTKFLRGLEHPGTLQLNPHCTKGVYRRLKAPVLRLTI